MSFDIEYEDWVGNSDGTSFLAEGTAASNVWISKVQAIFLVLSSPDWL